MSDPQPIAVLCPGQGAQSVGMGSAWAQTSEEARAAFDRADDLLAAEAEKLGWSQTAALSELCSEGPAETLSRTDVSQPALYTAGVASWHALRAQMNLGPAEGPIAAAAGLSLGEYTALHVAGAISFEDGLRLVTLRGRAMQDAAEASPSSMVALIGADEAAATELCAAALAEAGDGEILVPANFNAPGQIVISGSVAACDAAERLASDRGLRATRLAVAGAFHSPLMAPAAARLGEALATIEIKPPVCPVLSNVTGKPHEPEPASVRTRLVQQLTSPVRWAECCAWIAAELPGVRPHELAPGKTLAGLMRRIDKTLKVQSHDTP
ncbi:MAG: ACP S-malonyltransferase [Planctomycetota bacterium]